MQYFGQRFTMKIICSILMLLRWDISSNCSIKWDKFYHFRYISIANAKFAIFEACYFTIFSWTISVVILQCSCFIIRDT